MGNSRNIPKWMFRNETQGNDASLWAEKKNIYRYICCRFICRDFILENNKHYHLHPTPSPQLKLGVWNCMICRFRTILHEVKQIHLKTFSYYYDSFLSQGDYVNKLQHAMIEI